MNIDQKQIEEAVVSRAVEVLVDEFSGRDDLASHIKLKTTELIRQIIEERASVAIKAGLQSITMTRTNTFGESKGSPETLCEYVDRTIREHLNAKVDYNGKNEDSAYRSCNQTRLEWMIKEQVHKDIASAVNGAAVKMREQIASTIGKIVAKEIEEKVKQL